MILLASVLFRSIGICAERMRPFVSRRPCATLMAPQAFKDAVSEVGYEPDLLEDCVLMASEHAASTLRAQAVLRPAEEIGSGPWWRTWRANR